MWYITSQKNGVSALGLQRVLGLGSYRTAWLMLHKLRQAMVRPGREKLSGVVEVDETYWGSAEFGGATGRKTVSKVLIIVAAEADGKRIGRIRMALRQGGEPLLPRVHLVISLLKRWLLGTLQGSASDKYLEDYLNEFVFRFNRRRSASRGKLFYRLAQQAINAEPATYSMITNRRI